MAYNLAYAVFGGSAPYLAMWFVDNGHPVAPGVYLAGLCFCSVIAAAVGIGNNHRRPVNEGTETGLTPAVAP